MQIPLPFSLTAQLDIQWDWTAWLGSDSIASYIITPATGVTKVSDARNAGVVTAWVKLSGPAAYGATFDVVCSITTAGGRTDTRTITLVVTKR